MATFILAFLVMATVVTIMAIGVIVRQKPIKGTCASLSNLGANGECVICGKKPESPDDNDCGDTTPSSLKQHLYYAADKPQKQIK